MKFYIKLCKVAMLLIAVQVQALTINVATWGNDKNDASEKSPISSLAEAKNRLVKLSQSGELEDVKIKFKKGTYFFEKGVVFDEKIRLKKGAKLEIIGGKNVFFHGGKRFDASVLKTETDENILRKLPPEADKNHLRFIDLKENNIADYGEFGRRGFMLYGLSQAEVFVNKKPMQIARFPNGTDLLEIGEVISTVAKRDLNAKSVFKPAEGFERYKRWADADELFFTGRLSFGYNDATIKVLDFDAEKGIFTTENPIWGVHPGRKAFDKIKDKSILHRAAIPSVDHRGYAAYNILEEIDAEGEYVIDRKRKKIFIALADVEKVKRIDVSLLAEPFIKLDNISNVEIKGINFGYARDSGIELGKVSDVKIDRCRFFNLGLQGIKTSIWFEPFSDLWDLLAGEAKNVSITNSKFENLGCGGVYLCGGDARKLAHSGNIVKNCYFNNTSRINQTYSPAIWLVGCGGVAENNTITGNFHSAMFFNGCEITMRRNYIFDVCKHGMDMGAIYSGRNVYQRGNIIEENFIYYINPDATVHIHAIYLDDCLCGATIRRNIFCKAGWSGNVININKGFDHVITDNIFVDCKSTIIEWLRKEKDILSGLERGSRKIFGDEGLKNVMKKYPEAGDVLTRPHKSVVSGNRFYNCGKIQKEHHLTNAVVKNINCDFKTWDLSKIRSLFGDDELVRELTSLKFGADLSGK